MPKTVDIPGGQAVLATQAEVSPRKRRPVAVVSSMIGRKLPELQAATRIFCDDTLIEDHTGELKDDGQPRYAGGDCYITRAQLELLQELNDVSAWAMLVSWTLPIPLPCTPDEFLDIPPDVYDALRIEASVLIVMGEGGGFTLDEAMGSDPDQPDQTLPTSASAD